MRFHDPQHFPGGAPRIPGLAHKNVLKRMQLFPLGVERETTCCWATNWEVTSVADCTRTILSSSSSVKQDEAAGSYRFHCLLLRLPLSREAYGVSSFSHARRSLEVIFCSVSLHSSSPDQTGKGWSFGPRASAALRTTTRNQWRTAQCSGSLVLFHNSKHCRVL